MPVLPIIDLLILLGWSTIAGGAVLKAIYVTTSYRPTLLGLAPIDLLLVAGVFLGLALTLAARQWVKINDPRLTARRRADDSLPSPFVEFAEESAENEVSGAERATS